MFIKKTNWIVFTILDWHFIWMRWKINIILSDLKETLHLLSYGLKIQKSKNAYSNL